MPRRKRRYPTRSTVDTIEHGWCSACDWTVTGGRTRSRASDHAALAGHRVRTAQTVIVEYVPNVPPTAGRDLSTSQASR